MNTHLHVTSWALALILLLVVVILHKQGKAKGAKITQMILRVVYLIILYSGGSLIAGYFAGPNVVLAVFKAIAGLWTIAAIEMVAIKTVQDAPTQKLWIQLAAALVVTLIFGYVIL